MTRRAGARLAGVAFAALLAASSARAHTGHPELRGERFVRVALDGGLDGALPSGMAGLSYALVPGPRGAAAERERADLDGDGHVSALEGNAALDRLGHELLAHLTICRGRTLDRLACHAPEPRDVARASATTWGGDEGAPLALAWVVALRLDDDDAAVRIDDTWERPEVEATNVTLSAPAGRPLVRAGAADAPGVNTEFTWVDNVRAGRPRSIVAAWKPRPPRLLGPALVIAGALALLVSLARSRRVRARAQRQR